MKEATKIIQTALLSKDEEHHFNQLKEGMQQANDCFKRWGLISEQLEIHQNMMLSNGAIACKPTGSGAGGYVLSLWDKKAPEHLKLIEVKL